MVCSIFYTFYIKQKGGCALKEYRLYWKNAFDFSGRATRREYWLPTLYNVLISVALLILGFILSLSGLFFGVIFMILISLFGLATFIPDLSCGIRRLHDTGRSGWWYLIGLIPWVGGIILLIFLCQRSKSNDDIVGSTIDVEARFVDTQESKVNTQESNAYTE